MEPMKKSLSNGFILWKLYDYIFFQNLAFSSFLLLQQKMLILNFKGFLKKTNMERRHCPSVTEGDVIAQVALWSLLNLSLILNIKLTVKFFNLIYILYFFS